jgi:hypothetical protein
VDTIRFAKSDKRPSAIKAKAPGHVVNEQLVKQAMLGSFAAKGRDNIADRKPVH